MNMTKSVSIKEHTEFWDQYQQEMANGYGFGHPSEWNKDPRNFAAFCATKRVAGDFDKALNLVAAK